MATAKPFFWKLSWFLIFFSCRLFLYSLCVRRTRRQEYLGGALRLPPQCDQDGSQHDSDLPHRVDVPEFSDQTTPRVSALLKPGSVRPDAPELRQPARFGFRRRHAFRLPRRQKLCSTVQWFLQDFVTTPHLRIRPDNKQIRWLF